MPRLLIVSKVFLVISATCVERAQSAEPVLVFIDPSADERTLTYANSVATFDCMEQLSPLQASIFEDNSYYQISNPEGFDTRTGLVYFLDSSKLRRSRFWTVSGPEVFHDFLEFLTDVRGSGAKVEGDEFRKKISVSPVKPEPGKPHLTWHDIYVLYEDGVIFIGNSEIWNLKGAQRLQAIVKKSKGKDWYVWAGTKHVPKTARNVFMSALGLRAGVQMQRRDDEDDATFLSRRRFHESYLEAVRSVVFDLDEISAWTVHPQSNEPFRGHLSFIARPNTQLSQSLRTIRIASKVSGPATKLPIGEARACFQIPEEFRPLFQQSVKDFLGDRELANSLVRSIIQSGEIDVQAAVGVTEKGFPVVQAVLQLSEATSLREVADEAGLPFGPERELHVRRESPVFFRFLNEVSLQSFGQTIQLAMSKSGGMDVLVETSTDESGLRTASVVDVELDFGKVRKWPDNELATEFVRDLEHTYHRAKLLSRLSRVPSMAERVSNGEDFFHSIAEKIFLNGDWRVRLNLQVDGTGVSISTTVGREAYYWYVVRKLLAHAAELKL